MSKNISRGSICWLHFHNQAKVGHRHSGDYAYICAYAPKHSKKIEDGELYVKVAIKDIFFMGMMNRIRFVMEIMNTDGTVQYSITVDEPERLTPIGWESPDKINWSVKH